LPGKEESIPIGLGIATGGAIDARDGTVFGATDNLPGWAGFDLRGFAVDRFHLPTWVNNDAHAAALAELHFGMGRGVSDFVAITIGTGQSAELLYRFLNGFVFSMYAYMLCSLKSSCCDNTRTLGAISRGTTTTPSLSAATMSPAFTLTPSHTTGMPVPATR
jgi:hypothetical protein